MNRANQKMRDLAKKLLTHETGANASFGDSFFACDKLRPQFASLMGKEGFHALFSRALALSRAEVPWLKSVHVSANCTLNGLDEPIAQLDPKDIFDGRVIVLAHMLELLTTFIGEILMLRLLQDEWPNLRLEDLQSTKDDKK